VSLPLEGVTLHLFYLSELVSPLFFVNLPTTFSFGCHPPGGSPTPPSDATVELSKSCYNMMYGDNGEIRRDSTYIRNTDRSHIAAQSDIRHQNNK